MKLGGTTLARTFLCKFVAWLFAEYLRESASTYLLHIKTFIFVSLKGSENKELNYVPPNVYVEQGETSRLNDFYLGCSKTETMKQICEHWDNAGLTFSYEHFQYIFFYDEQFLVITKSCLKFKELMSESSIKCN